MPCNGTVRVVAYDANGWEQYVSIGDDKGWMLEDDLGNFNPNNPVTRAELPVVLSCILNF